MDIDKILWLILAAIMFPAIGVGLSAMAGGQHRVSRRPPEHPPGAKTRLAKKRANKRVQSDGLEWCIKCRKFTNSYSSGNCVVCNTARRWLRKPLARSE
jgi:hypothetical protein